MAAAPASGAFAETHAGGPASALPGQAPLPLGLKVCLVSAALGAALERLCSGGPRRT